MIKLKHMLKVSLSIALISIPSFTFNSIKALKPLDCDVRKALVFCEKGNIANSSDLLTCIINSYILNKSENIYRDIDDTPLSILIRLNPNIGSKKLLSMNSTALNLVNSGASSYISLLLGLAEAFHNMTNLDINLILSLSPSQIIYMTNYMTLFTSADSKNEMDIARHIEFLKREILNLTLKTQTSPKAFSFKSFLLRKK